MISVFDGDTAESISQQFIQEHKLNAKIQKMLTELIQMQMTKLKNLIIEKSK